MVDHTEAELKPCPFCGGAVNLEQTQDNFRDRETGTYRRWWGVICRNTVNVGGSCAVSVRPSASKGAAVGRWNQRATQASAPADEVRWLVTAAHELLRVADEWHVGESARTAMRRALDAHLRAPATRDKPPPVDATASLIDAARDLVDRWHTPVWKEVEHTAAFIARLDEAATRAAGAAPPAQQWVSVAERLPENEQEVLILFNPYGNPANKARVLEAVHTDGGFYDWDDGLELHHPTHWMPKPALQGAAPLAQQWPQGLLDRVKAATRRISDGHAPRRIPADPTDVDLVLGEVQALIEGRDPPFWVPPAPQHQGGGK